jgi:8-oxo-dGTP diphosphatase
LLGIGINIAPVTDSIRQFGVIQPGVDYVLRPGGYAIILNNCRQVAVIHSSMGMFLPGGGQDHGESLEMTVTREAKEESGISISGVKKLGVCDQLCFAKSENTYYRKREYFFLATQVGDPEPRGTEDEMLKWVDVDHALAQLAEEAQRWGLRLALMPKSASDA